MSDRQTSGIGFWAVIVVVAALAYALSFGPACWIVARAELIPELVNSSYRPVISLYNLAGNHKITPIETTIRWYAMLGIPAQSDWGFYPVDWEVPSGEQTDFEWGHDAR
jgi:hypothetical protein